MSIMSRVAIKNGISARRMTQAVLDVRSQGVQHSDYPFLIATLTGLGVASSLRCQTPREWNNHSSCRFSSILSRKAFVAAMRDIICGSK